jgi:CTP synthase (UTP-ammonia lyase)
VIGLADADTAEDSPDGKNLIIHPVACAVPSVAKGAPKLSGRVKEIRLRPGSFLESFYGKEVIEEEFFCDYEVNPDFEWCALEAGFPVVARGANNEVRAIESPAHRFFVAMLFQPQRSSTVKRPHPVILAFVKAAAEFARERNVLE